MYRRRGNSVPSGGVAEFFVGKNKLGKKSFTKL